MKQPLMKTLQNLQKTFSTVFQLEKKGLFGKAKSVLKTINPETLSAYEKAEFQLRLGALEGFLRNHDVAKNLLFLADEFFKSQSNHEKCAECENYLAVSYYRSGEINEAVSYLQESLSHSLPETHYQRLYSVIIEDVIDIDLGNNEKVIQRFEKKLETFETFADEFLLGSFYNHLAIAQQSLGLLNEAVDNYQIAYKFYKKIQHQTYCGSIENNLAQVHRKLSLFEIAHLFSEKSITTHKLNKNRILQGSSLDTKALIYYDENNFDEALKTINASIEILEGTGSNFLMLESLQTKIKILFAQKEFSNLFQTLLQAYQLALTYIGEEKSENLLYETDQMFNESLNPAFFHRL